jgi:DNA-binding transcriptional regulator YdaS (Cro superfamily)
MTDAILKTIKHFGNQKKAAQEIGVTQQLISKWNTGASPIPAKKCVLIEQLTCGEVTRQQLRPDLFEV